jgi:tetratricopeptide (TPR) repeat protein
VDRATEDYVRFIADSVPTSRLLLLLPYRTGYSPPFGERTYHLHVPLGALPATDSLRMARAMVGTSELPGEVEALLLDKAEGNPFFLEEIVRTLQDTGTLRHVDDRYVLTRPPAEIAVRPTIQDFIMARIDRLGEVPKRVLQLASVVGREFPLRLLDRIAEPAGQTREALEQLKAVELIHEKSIHGEVAFVFKHALTQETAYESILLHRRKELHARIGLALEELYAGRLPERYGVLAYHFSRAERPAKALEYLLKAADRAAGAYANNEARALYEQALPLIDAGDRPVRAEILRKLATVTQYIGDPDASLHYAESALELFEELGDKRGAVAMHLHIQALYTWQWDGAREDFGLKHLEAAAALVERDPDSVEKGLVFQRTGHLYLHRCQPATTLEWAQRAVDMFARLGVPMGTSLGTALTYTGRIDEGIGYAEPNWEPVLKAAIPMVMAVMGHELCLGLALARDIPRAAEWGERVLPHVVKTSPVFEGMLQRPLTLVYTLAGDVARAREACAAVERSEARSMLGCIYEDGAAVGFHHLRCGRWDQAKSYLERLLPVYEERDNRAAFAACALVMGQLRLELEDFAGAEALLSRALAVAREGGNVLLELWALPVLGELHLRGDHSEQVGPVLQRGFALLEPGRRWYGLPGPLFLVKGMLAGAERRWKDAAAAFDEAVALARRHHLPWDEARALYEQAQVHVAQGGVDDRAEAGRLFGMSLELFQRVGAVKDAEKVSTRKEMLDA